MRPAYEEFIDTYEIPLLYSFVGTKWFASTDDIKKAYKKTVKEYHPDVNEKHKDGMMIRMVNAAYEILIDPQKKAEYDAFLGSDEFWNRFGKILGRTGKKGDSGEGKAAYSHPRTENNSAGQGGTYNGPKYGPADEEEEDPPDVYDGEESFFGITGPMGCFLRYIYQYGGVVGAAGVLNWLCMKIFHCGIWDIFFR